MPKIPSPHFQMLSLTIVFFNLLIDKFWNSILLTYISKFLSSQRELHSSQNIDFVLGGAPTSICHFFSPSVRRAPYTRNRTSSNQKGQMRNNYTVMHHIEGTVEHVL